MSAHGILVVDKPGGCTSHDVVRVARRAYQTRAVGHAGTLDPMATGVLVLAIGEGTKLVQYLTAARKRYSARVRFGWETDTLDAEGAPSAPPVDFSATDDAIETSLSAFRGTYEQVVPKVSAVRVGGKRLHELARQGVEVELPSRTVSAFSISLEARGEDWAEVILDVSKGFYVRSFARDWARSLGSRGHLAILRRLASGEHSIEQSTPFETLEAAAKRECAPPALTGLADACTFAGRAELDDAGIIDAVHGRPVPSARATLLEPSPNDTDLIALVDSENELVALARQHSEHYQVVRGFPREARRA